MYSSFGPAFRAGDSVEFREAEGDKRSAKFLPRDDETILRDVLRPYLLLLLAAMTARLRRIVRRASADDHEKDVDLDVRKRSSGAYSTYYI